MNMEQKMFSEMLGSALPCLAILSRPGLRGWTTSWQLAGMMGMPIRMQTPEAMQSFINKYKPQQPVEPVVQPQQPQVQNPNRGHVCPAVRQHVMGPLLFPDVDPEGWRRPRLWPRPR